MEAMQSVAQQKSFAFAVRVVRLSVYLKNGGVDYVLVRQILKSGTSVGANIEEAEAALTPNDFSSKISIAYKEIRETKYWLRLLSETGFLASQEFDSIYKDADEIAAILFSILKSTKRIPTSS